MPTDDAKETGFWRLEHTDLSALLHRTDIPDRLGTSETNSVPRLALTICETATGTACQSRVSDVELAQFIAFFRRAPEPVQ